MYRFYDEDEDDLDLHTLPGLTNFLRSPGPRRPTVMPTNHRFTAPEKLAYNDARSAYMSGGIIIRSKQHEQAALELMKVTGQNRAEHGHSASLLVSGASTLGKTTLLRALMKDYYSDYRSRFPDYERHGRVPIVFVEVPPGCTGKLLMIAFAEFFGIAHTRSETGDAIRIRIIAAMKRAKTQLVVVDELHKLNAQNRGNGESIHVLRNLHNLTRATFVYAGAGLRSVDLLAGPEGQQLLGRSVMMDMTRFNLSNPRHAADWRGIVAAFEKALPLAEQEPKALLRMSTYLWDRTAGSIGSLGRLLTGAAEEILQSDGALPENITRELLDKQINDSFAEIQNTVVLRKKRGVAA
jgi:hypothetical protein